MSNQTKITAEEIEARYNNARTNLPWEAWLAYCEILVWNDPKVEEAEEDYLGEFRNATELAEHLVDSTGILSNAPTALVAYFDYEAYGRDIMLGGDAWEHNGFFFNNR
jgi:antirestriction protein